MSYQNQALQEKGQVPQIQRTRNSCRYWQMFGLVLIAIFLGLALWAWDVPSGRYDYFILIAFICVPILFITCLLMRQLEVQLNKKIQALDTIQALDKEEDFGMSKFDDIDNDLLERAHLDFLRGEYSQARQKLQAFLTAHPQDSMAHKLLAQINQNQATALQSSAAMSGLEDGASMDLLDKPVQDSVNPQNVRVLAVKAVILIFSLILLYAVVVGLPYLIALAHGVPLDGNLHGRDRYGMSRVYPLRPMVTFSVITFIVITPPLLVAAALLRNWTAARNK